MSVIENLLIVGGGIAGMTLAAALTGALKTILSL
jgi:2-polyprenyl-6-methoxyphenol hydroxylase-like FAD-dependent oxidoreductase